MAKVDERAVWGGEDGRSARKGGACKERRHLSPSPGNWFSVADSSWLRRLAWSRPNVLNGRHGLTAMRTSDNLLLLWSLLV